MDWLLQLEINITLFVQSWGVWLKGFFTTISLLATEKFFIILMPLIFWCVDSLMGIRLAFMLVLSDGLNNCFKMLFHTPRPFWFDARVKSFSDETGFGLPSGHSQNSASVWGMIAGTAKKKWLTISLIIMIFLVGLSRIYLGMHFLHDVLSGWLIAGLLLLAYFKLEKPVIKWISPKKLSVQILYIVLFSFVIILLSVGAIAVNTSWQMPPEWIETAAATHGAVPDPFNLQGVFTLGGVAFGFLSGYAWWVNKYGMPKVEGSWTKRLLRYCVGIVGVIFIYAGLKMVFPTEPLTAELIFRYIRYAILGLWVSALAPALFRTFKLDK